MHKDNTYYMFIIDGYALDHRITLYDRRFDDKGDALRFFHNLDMRSAYEIYGLKNDDSLTATVFEIVNLCGETDVRVICSCTFCG